jgi:transposase
MNFFLGCDVSKNKIDASLINEAGTEQWSDSVSNTVDDLCIYLLTMQGAYPNDTIRIVVESTGRYHYPLLDTTAAVGLPCLLYNPILTKQQIKASRAR